MQRVNERITLKNTLINTRAMTSLLERELALATGEIKRETKNWVPMWVDWGHAFRSDKHTATAIRAISDTGELLWYVRHDAKKHGYHSCKVEPFQAISQARRAWHQRRVVRKEWANVVATSNELMTGRRKMTITLQDIEDSALCSLGASWFLKRFGLSHKQTFSGRTVALLMKIEPQVGFVIHQTALRYQSKTLVDIQTGCQLANPEHSMANF
ncbi:MAG: hypothetical protein V3V25_00125 [Paracoccaceae bacterium]